MSSTTMYKALLKAGVDEELATLAANDVTEPAQVVSKADLAEMKVDIIKWMVAIGMAQTILVVTLIGIMLKTVS